MQSDWEKAISFVLEMEGGYTNDPNDSGGETNFGISKKAYPSLNIAELTVDEAKIIYMNDYWNQVHGDELPSAFAIAIFDTAVNEGTGTARRLLQIALGVTVDGNIGSQTIAAAFKATDRQVKMFLAERLASYMRIMASKPGQAVFALNWSFRVIALSKLIFTGDAR